jgi:hypothetical protein
MIQEIAQDCLKNRNIQVNNEKAKLAIWMGTQSDVLQKINLYILQEWAKWRIGNIGLSAKPNQSNVSGDEDQRPCYNSTL